ncbi:AEC family transporter [bacterium]|nr:MAG: AEC family transporter [bacterium]
MLQTPKVLRILWDVIAPIFGLIALGYVVQKRVGLDLKTLTRLNFWMFVPAFLWVHIFESTLKWAELSAIFLHFLIFFPLLGVITWFSARLIHPPDRLRRAITASVLFYNSGNYGIPVAQLAFPGQTLPLQIQAAMVMLQNMSNFSLGVWIIAGGRGGRRRDTLKTMFKLPMIYVLVIAWTMRALHLTPPAPLNTSLHWLSEGLVPIAVTTLGAQMAGLKVPRFNAALVLALSLRLFVAPILGFAVVWGLGLHGTVAESLTLSTAFPTAVNSALLAHEFDNEPEFAAAAVFYSTLFSVFSVSLVIWATRVMQM